MIFHMFPNEKFTDDYIERINKIFGDDMHNFFVYGKQKITKESYSNVKFDYQMGNIKSFFFLLRNYLKADKIILHNFPGTLILGLICVMQMFKKKFVWVVWGGELYDMYEYNHNPNNQRKIKVRINEGLRKYIIGHLDMISAFGDYEEVKKRYSTNAKKYPAVYGYKLLPVKEISEKTHRKMKILLGHSATETCGHLEVLDLLKKYVGMVEIICPMSYPNNQKYIAKVQKKGKNIFGEDCKILTEFMEYEQYIELLNSVDVGIFNNNRQQGNGNITNLLYLGKKVYVAQKNNIYEDYTKLGAKLFTIEDILKQDFFYPLDAEVKKRNHDIVAYKYSDENFFHGWNKIFKE